jgi:hypothetical protein
MKTPMQELIEQLNNVKPQDFCSIEAIKGWAESMLNKEKEVVKAAYNKGYRDSEIEIGVSLRVGDISKYSNAETYYNETFNTKEK